MNNPMRDKVDMLFDQLNDLLLMYPNNKTLRARVLQNIDNTYSTIDKINKANVRVAEWLKEANS